MQTTMVVVLVEMAAGGNKWKRRKKLIRSRGEYLKNYIIYLNFNK